MSFPTAENILSHAQDIREEMARVLFDYGTVGASIKEAATAGQYDLRIVQEEALSLKGTKAATHLVAKLKAAGFTCEWQQAGQHEKIEGRQTATVILYDELLIRWGHTERRLAENSDMA